jgi:hypothetical protein
MTKIKPYPTYKEVFNTDKLEGIFVSLCSVNNFLHFVTPLSYWRDDSCQTAFNSSSFCIFDLEDGRYNFNGNPDFYSCMAERKDIFNGIDKESKVFCEKRFNIKGFIHNWGFTDRGSVYESFAQSCFEFSITKHMFKKTGKLAGYDASTKLWKTLVKSPMVYLPDSKEFKRSFSDIEVNAKYLLPPTIKLEEWQPIGVVLGSEFFANNADSYLFWNEEKAQVLMVYSHS